MLTFTLAAVDLRNSLLPEVVMGSAMESVQKRPGKWH
jgi:hypothetical protein